MNYIYKDTTRQKKDIKTRQYYNLRLKGKILKKSVKIPRVIRIRKNIMAKDKGQRTKDKALYRKLKTELQTPLQTGLNSGASEGTVNFNNTHKLQIISVWTH